MPTAVFDTHCHLTYGDLGEQADAAWSRARAAGVCGAVLIGIDAASSREVTEWVADTDDLWCTVGIHPNGTAKAKPDDLGVIRELAARPRVVALGETGLDTYWDDAPLDIQVASLIAHADLALELDLPLVLHLRDAFPQAEEVLQPYARRGLRAVVHCFTGGPEHLQPFLDWGFMISFSGILTYSGAKALREAAAVVPLDQCLVETDAPWLTPAPHKTSDLNEPAFILLTAKKLAKVKKIPFDELAAITTANARRFFDIDKAKGRPAEED
ncbi:MAG: hypothetical protein CMJ90_13430 [Planctomycetes bacterium]|nr:hypothetical protein [Planctomycetota bacterium]